jgi:predicted HicB family RNase H-like nuclease
MEKHSIDKHGADKAQEVLRIAQQIYDQDPDWVTFFREVLGLGGVMRRAYPETADLNHFERTREYGQLQGMLSRLRERGRGKPNRQEPLRVITVRMPKSLHDSLRAEAHERRTSMNKLCIAKLLQMVDGEMVAVAGMVESESA